MPNRKVADSGPAPLPPLPSLRRAEEINSLKQSLEGGDEAAQLVREVQAMVSHRQRQRLAASVRIMKMQLGQKLPPPTDLVGQNEKKQRTRFHDDDSSSDDSELSEEDPLDNLPKIHQPIHDLTVKRMVVGHIDSSARGVQHQHNAALTGRVPPSVTTRLRAKEETLLLEAPPRTQTPRALTARDGPTKSAVQASGSGGQAAPSTARNAKQIQRRVPSESPPLASDTFLTDDGQQRRAGGAADDDGDDSASDNSGYGVAPKVKGDSDSDDENIFDGFRAQGAHTQVYRRGNFQSLRCKAPKSSGPGHHSHAPKAADVQYFLKALDVRRHQFNRHSQLEVGRAIHAQNVFHATKVATFEHLLTVNERKPMPARKMLSMLRGDVNYAARKKDHDERLDVYYHKLDRVASKLVQRYPSYADETCDFVARVKEYVTKQNGEQKGPDFQALVLDYFRKAEGCRPNVPTDHPTAFLRVNVTDLLQGVSVIFRMKPSELEQFIVEQQLKVLDHDFGSCFKNVERDLGKDVSNDAHFRLFVLGISGLNVSPSNPPGVSVRVDAERKQFTTETVHHHKPKWKNSSFKVDLYHEDSPVTLNIRIDGAVVGLGTFGVNRLPPGRLTEISVPTNVAGATVRIAVEVDP